jgi:hypothetical protein
VPLPSARQKAPLGAKPKVTVMADILLAVKERKA